MDLPFALLSVSEHACKLNLRCHAITSSKAMQRLSGWKKLPRKAQIVVLILIMLAAGVIQFLMGLHSVHTGQDIVLAAFCRDCRPRISHSLFRKG
jgi:hypothetical protein